jgi:hypothetical protein
MKNNRLKIFHLTCLTIIAASLLVISIPEVIAAEMSQGEMAGIIRSSGNPCNKVLDLMPTSDSSWTVQCNSGKFVVKRDAEGQYSVEPVE